MNCLCVADGEGNGGTVVDHVRLFRKLPEHRWKYRVHEQILPALRATKADVRWTDIVIQHAGYQDPALTRHKLERNLRLLHLDHVDHPRDPYILFHLGWANLELGRPAEAIGFLRASLDGSHPADSIVKKLYALLAQAHQRLGQREEALAALRAGRARYPEDLELLYLEGILHRERREWDRAERCLKKLVSSEWLVVSGPESHPSVAGVARPEPSEGRGETAIASTPVEDSGRATQPTTHHSPLTTHSSTGQFGSVDVGLTGYLAHNQLALVYYQQGNMAKAEAEWKLALAQRPRFLDALKGLGELYLEQRRWPDLGGVVECLKEKIGNHESHELHEWEGKVLEARGMLARKEFDKAREILEPVVTAQPAWVYPRVILSHVYLQHGTDHPAAERVLREIVEMDAGLAEAWRNLAVLLRDEGRFVEAAELCRTGWRHCPGYPPLPLLLGLTLVDLADLAGAETCFLRLLELPYAGLVPEEHLAARHQLAMIYQAAGRPIEAQAQWRTILSERPDYGPALDALKQLPEPALAGAG